MTIEALYKARYELRKNWGEQQIRDSIYRMMAAFGFPLARELMPEIYEWVMRNKK